MEPQEISDAFGRLQQSLEAIGAPILDHLTAGLKRSEIDRKFDAALPLHPHLLGWFGAHNGTDIVQPATGVNCVTGQQLCGLWHIMSLEDTTRSLTDVRKSLNATAHSEWFPATWLPVLKHLTGALLCIDTHDPDGTLYVHHVHSELPSDPPRRSFANLGDFADTYAYLIDQGLVTHNSERGMETNESALPRFLTDGRPTFW